MAVSRFLGRLSRKSSLLVIVVVLAIGLGVVWFEVRGETDVLPPQPERTEAGSPVAGSAVLELSAGPLVTSAAPCPEIEPPLIASATVAFLGTVTETGEGFVELRVDKSFTGVDEEEVRVTASRSVDFWLGPVSWGIGSQYLVAAHSGLVRFCGQTSRATPELQAVFDEAFSE